MGKLLDKLRRVQVGGRPFCTMIVPAAGSSARGTKACRTWSLAPRTHSPMARMLSALCQASITVVRNS